ncbi:hypothetical protein G7054_g11830 [Neopestalotiopsis clavispora]|nr:hypothetical protein G7054_g11830 [Neopestalotiopsis clavispora]
MAATFLKDRKYFYICIGKVGAGRISFISDLGGQLDSSSPDAKRCKAKIYTFPEPDQSICMINAPAFQANGFPLSSESQGLKSSLLFSDQTNQIDLLRLLNQTEIRHVNGIFWHVNVSSSEKELEAQARFIDDLLTEVPGPTPPPRSKWDQVVVIHNTTMDRRFIQNIVSRVTSSHVDAIHHMKDIETIIEDRNRRRPPTNADKHRRRSSLESTDLTAANLKGVLPLIRCHSEIRWSNRKDECENCGQTGDHRTFYPCHAKVERIHQKSRYHGGNLVKVHEPRDTLQRVVSQAQGAPFTIEVALNQSTAASSASCPEATQSWQITLRFNITGSPKDSMGLSGSGVAVTPQVTTPECMITGYTLPKEEVAKIESSTTMIGVCRICNKDASGSVGCLYYWTCCEKSFDPSEVNNNELERCLGGTCKLDEARVLVG